ncbi:hypothetical protein SH528x_002230 [Novipirellula sp. SH528]|uniref:hypothetical protein n=1 Tax=Novipirellula sp. SH528 TaxID=3454466 RepID=UPI003F9F8740
MKRFRHFFMLMIAGCLFATTGCGPSNEVTVNQPEEIKTKEQILEEIAKADAENARLERERADDE